MNELNTALTCVDQVAPNLDDIPSHELVLIRDILLDTSYPERLVAEIRRGQPDVREEIPGRFIEFSNVPHDVHVTHVVAVPGEDRAAVCDDIRHGIPSVIRSHAGRTRRPTRRQ